MLEKAMIIQNFDIILSNQDVTKSKPDPEIYVTCMKRLEVSPRETLIIEDNEHGIKAAVASGAHLMTVQSIYDVTYVRIMERIEALNRETTS